jgi:hypothetical protein
MATIFSVEEEALLYAGCIQENRTPPDVNNDVKHFWAVTKVTGLLYQ